MENIIEYLIAIAILIYCLLILYKKDNKFAANAKSTGWKKSLTIVKVSNETTFCSSTTNITFRVYPYSRERSKSYCTQA